MKILTENLPSFMRSICSIEDEGAEGGSSGGSQPAGNAEPEQKLTTAQALEKEFGQPITADEDGDDDSSGEEADEGEEGDEASSDEEEGGDDAEESSGEEGEAEPAPKKNRVQERIDELTNAARTHEREAEKWRELALKYGAPEDPDAVAMPVEPDPEKYTYGEHDLDYIKDVAKYEAKVEVLQEQAEANFKSETANLEAKWSKTMAEALPRYTDFEDVVVKGAENWACPPVIALGIKDSTVGADVAYELAKNPSEASRIAKLSPLEQAREFGRLEQRHMTAAEKRANAAAEEPKPKPKIVTKAPTPPKNQIRGGGGKFETAPDTDDFAAFDRLADKVLAKHTAR